MGKMRVMKHVIMRLFSAHRMATHDYFNVFLKCKNEIDGFRRMDLSNARVLIIGCGYNYPDVALWSSAANTAVGVDVRTAFLRSRFTLLNRSYRADGKNLAESFARSTLLRWTYRSYYDRLRDLSGICLNEHSQEILTYDGTRLPFADESFDVVCSNAVLEHVSELDAVSKETQRVMSPSGICYHLWHNYQALSGAHVPEDLAIGSPWGHLVGDPRIESWLNLSGTYLNRKSPSEIADVLSRDLEPLRINQLDKNHNRKGLDDAFEYEGVDLLTEDLANKLSDYSKEALLTRAYSFIGVKK